MSPGAGGARRRRPIVHPGPRRRLPPELRADKVTGLAQALPGGLADRQFESLVARIDDAPVHAGNRVEIFCHGDQAFASMLGAVSAARDEVLLESYIFKDDPTGQQFQRALIEAARRGVAVRVLADGVGSIETRASFWGALRENGVEARLFHPVAFPLRYLNLRDHRKILVTDRRVAFTGGMNIGDEYGSSLLGKGDVWRDTHARVEGPAAWEMAVVFEEGWIRAGGSPIGLESLTAAGGAGARVLILDSRPGRGQQEVSSVYAAIAGAARRRLWITVAYFAPRTRAIRILGAAAARGVDVRLLLPGKSDVSLVRHAGHGFFSGLLRRGVRIFEYQEAILHAKTMVADGQVSVIGSSNLDFRSFELNAECNFLVLDEPTGLAMEARFEEDLAVSREILLGPWRKRSWWHRAADGGARRLAPLL